LNPIVQHSVAPRRGSALFVTLVMISVIGFLLFSTADNVMGTRSQTWIGLAKQKAGYAAESVASDQEDKLVQEAAANNLAGLESMTNYGVEWFNDCVVRWRIEPVRTTATDANYHNVWSVNPPSNVSLYSSMASFAGSDGTYLTNYDYYVFRVDTEAWALTNPNFVLPNNPTTYTPAGTPDGPASGDGSMPWKTDGASLANVQSSRVIQLRLNSLFKYCIFYAASGPTGDIEFHPGAEMTIPGAVHSNGAIYFGGSGTASSAPPANAGPVYIGGVTSGLGTQTTVVGVDGIFRMRKSLNVLNGVTNPLNVAIGSNLNGGLDSPYEMNDLQLNCDNSGGTYCNDSRNGPMLQSVYGSWVRDGITLGATTVSTLSNIPQLAGRPFEAVQEAPLNSNVYLINSTGSMTDPTNWTIRGGAGNTYPAAVPLVYKNPNAGDYTLDIYTWFTDPPSYPSPTSSQSVAVPGGATILSTPVPATGMPLYGTSPGDITQMTPVSGVGGFDSNEFQAPYYADAITGKGDGTYGIVVRERLNQLNGGNSPTHAGWPDVEPTSNASYYTLLNFFGLPTDGTAPSPSWIVYSGCPNNSYSPTEYTEASNMLVIGATGASGMVPTVVNSWVASGTTMLAQYTSGSPVGLGRDYYNMPALGDANREVMPRLDYYIHITDAGSYTPFLLSTCDNTVDSTSAGSSYLRAYVGFTPMHTVSGSAYPNYLTGGVVKLTLATSTSTTAKWSTLSSGSLPVSLSTGDYVMHVWMADDSIVLSQIALYVVGGSVVAPSGSTAKTATVGSSMGLANWTAFFPTTAPTYNGVSTFLPVGSFSSLNPYQAEVLYMKSQYAALMGTASGTPIDITNSSDGSGTAAASTYNTGFFGITSASPSPVASVAQLPTYESNLMNRREAEWMRYRIMDSDSASASLMPKSYLSQSYKSYTCNTITLNLDQAQNFIKANYVSPTTTFNGLIFVARTRRGSYPIGYNPVLTPTLAAGNYTAWAVSATSPWGGWPSNAATLGTTPQNWFEQWNGGAGGNRLNNRVPQDGPDYVFHESVRLAQGSQINWGGLTSDVPAHIKGLTVVSPNTVYMDGDYNIIPDMTVSETLPSNIASIFPSIPVPMTVAYMHTELARADSGSLTETQLSANVHYPPCAVFADQITVLSNAWTDAGQIYNTDTNASETWYNTSFILNNVPTDASNVVQEGSGGMHNVTRYIEGWGSIWYHFRGSLVCMNAARYTDGYILSTPSEDTGCTMATAYGAPNRDLRFNTDLLTQSGQPPFSPFGVQVVRTVSTINDGNQ